MAFTGISSDELTAAAVETRRKLGTEASIRCQITVTARSEHSELEILWVVMVRRNKKPTPIGTGGTYAIAISNAMASLAVGQ